MRRLFKYPTIIKSNNICKTHILLFHQSVKYLDKLSPKQNLQINNISQSDKINFYNNLKKLHDTLLRYLSNITDIFCMWIIFGIYSVCFICILWPILWMIGTTITYYLYDYCEINYFRYIKELYLTIKF